jgi:hypothetical protein
MSDKPVTLKVGDTYRRKAISVTSAVVEYSSSKTDVATVDNEGLVIAKAEGTTTITATATGYSSQNGKKIYQPASVSYVVTVTPATVPATSLTLNKTMEVLVKNGDALTITATATPAEATLTWESSDEAVATVVNGVVTPKGVGIATITAKSGDVTATCEVFVGNEVDLGALVYEAKNYDILKGNMGANQLTIPNDIKVAFNGVTTTKQIICSGDATIYLTDGSENTVTESTIYKAGIKNGEASTTTLTINGETAGTGKLTVQGGDGGAGIGTNAAISSDVTGGNIVINGGTVTANGGACSAGIGTGDANHNNSCGAITINGGTVEATGGPHAAGIGTGDASDNNTCGAITIGTGVTSVTATKGALSPNSIGEGYASGGTQKCGKITFGTLEVFDGTTRNPDPMVADTYGGLTLAISRKNVGDDTWTLTPAP